ncbi:hypothetical protein C1T17_02305 [Sphingobium sp. SCG-1]|uniref:hypothetical protein n=1 Tax=Sphingobium sp. SCG-1 TaxID=2072936 RepID=UPI000CD6B9C1|nr:hypothetical protein [Sphingobium sp. SCG-1]AUW57087.1 hypothetical protein C1T17_02305 [Sphingobium sp. SCG-1]
MTNQKIIVGFASVVTVLLTVIALFIFRGYYDALSPCDKLEWHFWDTGAEHKCIIDAMKRANERGGVLSVQDEYAPLEDVEEIPLNGI